MNKPTVLMILDGYGLNESIEGNAVKLANTPNLDRYFEKYPNNIVHTSGLDGGLPDGQRGNSEVGHLNIGAGRIVYQDFTRISKSITDGDFFDNEAFLNAINNVNDAQIKSDEMTVKLAKGENVDLHQVMISAEKASVTMAATMEIRNKVIEAYQEVMRMQV